MRRIVTFATIALVALLGAPTTAGAQTLDEVVEAVQQQGFYADAGADVDTDELRDVLGARDDAPKVVVLAADDPDGASFAAEQVLNELEGDNTVLVVSPGEVASVSDVFSDSELDAALDAALESFDAGGSTSVAVSRFGVSLGLLNQRTVQAPEQTPAPDDTGGGGGAAWLIFLLIVVAVIGGLIWLSRRKARTVDDAEVSRARTEIKAQLEVVAHEIVEYEDEIDVSGHEAAIAHFRSANATYMAVSEKVDSTENLFELASLHDEIDRARWELEAARALIDGREVPPEPVPEQPSACFFDPTHKPGTETCTIKTSAGDKEVRVCRECARKLEKGEKPEPRMIDVGGRRVPSAKAPRSHGGLGMGGLSIFEVILGGLGALAAGRGRGSTRSAQPSRASGRGVDIDWGEMLPKRRRSGDVFSQDRLPPRPRTLPRTPATRPTGASSRSRGRGLPARPTGRSRRRR